MVRVINYSDRKLENSTFMVEFSFHISLNNAPARVSNVLKNEILDNFNELMKLKFKEINLFFTDIDKIKLMMEQELNEIKK